MAESEEEKEMRKKVLTYRVLEGRLRGLAQEREMVASKILEIRVTLASIEEAVKSEGDVLFSLGSEAHVLGSMKDKKNVIVEIGSGIALEKGVDDAKAILEKRLKELESALSDLQNEMMNVSSALSELGSQLQADAVEGADRIA